MLLYRAAVDLSPSHVDRLARLLRGRRRLIGTKWRALSPRRQALLVLVHLRCGTPYAQLAAAFKVGVGTVWRYVTEAVNVLAEQRKSLPTVLSRPGQVVILDGTIIATDRVANPSFYSGHKHRFGVNIQAIMSLSGRVLWTSDGLPGSVHDIRAARTHDIIAALENCRAIALADAGYIGAGHSVIHPQRRNFADQQQRRVDTANARLRCQGERGFAQLKTWKILTRYCGCPTRIGNTVAAITTLL